MFWSVLGASWGVLGRSGRVLGRSGARAGAREAKISRAGAQIARSTHTNRARNIETARTIVSGRRAFRGDERPKRSETEILHSLFQKNSKTNQNIILILIRPYLTSKKSVGQSAVIDMHCRR